MSDTPVTDKAFAYYRDGQHLVEAEVARQLERENAALKNGQHLLFSQRELPKVIEQRDKLERENAALRDLLHEIQENTCVSIKTCARIDAALDAARKEQP